MPEFSTSRGLVLLGRGFSAALIAGLIATPIFAQQQERMPRECRQEIRELCGNDRSKIRQCLQERFGELSESCADTIRERVSKRRQNRGQKQGDNQANTENAQRGQDAYRNARLAAGSVVYGQSQRQQVDIYAPRDAINERPAIVFIHGGGWSMGDRRNLQSQPSHFTDAGYIFASAGYRLVPNVSVEDQAKDIGAAVQALVGQASTIGVDPSRIVLMGHSAGAHLAALVASDPQYAGEAFGSIKGVILLDGAGYDVAANMEAASPRAWQLYFAAFGNEAERHAALSPITHVGGEDAPHWLALYVEQRDASRTQSKALMNALTQAGVNASALPIGGTDHGGIKKQLGTQSGAAQTEAVDAFLEMVFE